MTTHPSSEKSNKNALTQADKLPKTGFFKNLKIGTKLTIGFCLLVILMLVSVGVSYLVSNRVTAKITQTGDVRVPTALVASRAQANLLRILASVRGYLALGDPKYLANFNQFTQAFEVNLAELHDLSPNLDPENSGRLRDLEESYKSWSELPIRLFELHDDQLKREPAYRLLTNDGIRYAEQVLKNIDTMIEIQGEQELTSESLDLLRDIAKFQGNFAAMVSALQGYVTTRNPMYKENYEGNLADNQRAWEWLSSKYDALISAQQKLFDNISQNRDSFLRLPEQIFSTLESDHWREDWYIFTQKAVPYTDIMQQLLAEMTEDQQTLLTTELSEGRQDLTTATRRILAGGVIAIILGVAMSFIFRGNIAGPVRQLTATAERIRSGDLNAQTCIESKDEIGILAETFNNMTSQLCQTLSQARKEKKRADDLLDVVIPIGVQLSSEKDFNRLLEKILVEAKSFCHADAGTLYLRTEDEHLKFVILRNDTKNIAMGGTSGQEIPFAPLPIATQTQQPDKSNLSYIAVMAAQDGISSNIPNYNHQSEIISDYPIISVLTIPLKNSLGQVQGVMQLFNAQDAETKKVIPFDQNLQQMMESFSLLAVAALEAYIREQILKQEIQQLQIEVDEAKRQKQVQEITGTESFKDLQTRAAEMRGRRSSKRKRGKKKEIPEKNQPSQT